MLLVVEGGQGAHAILECGVGGDVFDLFAADPDLGRLLR